MDGVNPFNQYYQEYDEWFELNQPIYQAEIHALQRLVPTTGYGVEIGMGTGRFTTPFTIKVGIDPAMNMCRIAKERGISVCQAVGEHLPFTKNQFDFALLVTVVCFVKSIPQLLGEVNRVITFGGKLIIGFIDRETPLGQVYQSRKDSNKFYRAAQFYSAEEIADHVHQSGFHEIKAVQTIFGLPGDKSNAYRISDGYGEGAFVAMLATKQ